jgi:nitroreductase
MAENPSAGISVLAPFAGRTAMNHPKRASADHPIHELLMMRYSPYAFSDRAVAPTDLKSIFEAARWAPSAFNEQPWRYIVATKEEPEEFGKLLSCLVEGNQTWARNVPVLALGVTRVLLTRNAKPNRVALHDLGLASACLVFEAMSRGIYVHQMGGILPDRARELYQIPPEFEVVTGIALGYPLPPDQVPEELKARDLAPRTRRPLAETVFVQTWGAGAPGM